MSKKGCDFIKISENGKNLIKKYEGLKLTAYKAHPSEKYYTIGYGHYGSDVKPGKKITKEEADKIFEKEIPLYEGRVMKYYSKYKYSQNEFDALVSFCYNVGNIDQLTANGTRSKAKIANSIPLYNKCGGQVLKGLVARRKEEKELFLRKENKYIYNNIDFSRVFDPIYYKNKYQDLKAAFGDNNDALFQHFLIYGMKEGRIANSTFNVHKYKEHNIDLKIAFDNNLIAYYEHFCRIGYKENRRIN